MHAELRDRGYHGTIRLYLKPFRETAPGARPAQSLRPGQLDPRRPRGNLDEDETTHLARARERCPHLNALASHVTEFAKILTSLRGDRLDDWISAVEADDQPDLHSFTCGLKRDHHAVVNGLTLPWSSGVVERKRQPARDAQTPDLRPRRLQPDSKASPPGHLKGSVIITEYDTDTADEELMLFEGDQTRISCAAACMAKEPNPILSATETGSGRIPGRSGFPW